MVKDSVAVKPQRGTKAKVSVTEHFNPLSRKVTPANHGRKHSHKEAQKAQNSEIVCASCASLWQKLLLRQSQLGEDSEVTLANHHCRFLFVSLGIAHGEFCF
jgi:hypothetical protein